MKGCGRVNVVEYYIYTLTYENGKRRPVESTLRIGGGRIKGNVEGLDLTTTYSKQFCKCGNVPPVQ